MVKSRLSRIRPREPGQPEGGEPAACEQQQARSQFKRTIARRRSLTYGARQGPAARRVDADGVLNIRAPAVCHDSFATQT